MGIFDRLRRHTRGGDPSSPRPDPSERRSEPRFELRVKVDLRGPHGFTTAVMENLSRSGLFVATESPNRIGDRVWITLRLFHAPEMEIEGEVRWVREASKGRPAGMGVLLLELTPAQQRLIDSFLASAIKPLVEP